MRRNILLVDFISVLFIFEKFGKWQNDMRNGRNTTVDKFRGMVFLKSAIKCKKTQEHCWRFQLYRNQIFVPWDISLLSKLESRPSRSLHQPLFEREASYENSPDDLFCFYFKGIWILPFKRGFNLLGNSLKLTYQ